MDDLIESVVFQQAVGAVLALVSIGGGLAIGIEARLRHAAPLVVAIAAGVTFLFGAGTAGLATAHLFGVIWTGAQRGAAFSYDFRFSSLLLLGTMLVVAGTLCAAGAHGLGAGRKESWVRAIQGTLLLLLVSATLAPVPTEQARTFGSGLAQFSVVNLVLLLAARLSLRTRREAIA